MFALLRHRDLGAEMREHLLGVVAGGFGLDHGGLAGRGERGQQHGRLDLRRGDRRAIGDRDRLLRAAQGQRHAAALLLRDDDRAHLLERVEDAPHRPLAQRGVAIEGRGDRMRAADAHHQARAGAGIAEIENLGWFAQAADADALHAPGAGPVMMDDGAECAGRCGRAHHVLAFEQAGDLGLADRQEAEDHRPVRDRLVAGHADAALQRPPGAGGDGNGVMVVGHGGRSLRAGRKECRKGRSMPARGAPRRGHGGLAKGRFRALAGRALKINI